MVTLTAIKLVHGHDRQTYKPVTMLSEIVIDFTEVWEADMRALVMAMQGYLVSTEEVV